MKRALGMAAAALLVVTGGCRAVSERTGTGKPWQAVAFPFDADVRALFFLDTHNGWAVGGERGVKGGLFASTQDGGNTWSVQTNVVQGLLHPERFSLSAVRFVDPSRGWIGGHGGVILRTLDGGKTWDKQVDSRLADGVGDLFFLDADRGWAALNDGILWTTDGGEHWQGNRGPYVHGGRAIQFLDESTGFVAGRLGIQKSIDGGRSWTDLAAPDVRYSGLHFVTPLLGWAVGEGGTIVHTRDGGETWQTQATGLRAFPWWMDVKFVDEQHGYVVGSVNAPGWNDSMILYTEDGGQTWRLQQEPEHQQLTTLDLLDADHAWTAGERTNRGPVVLMRLQP